MIIPPPPPPPSSSSSECWLKMLAGGYRGCLEWFSRRLAVLIFYELHETHSLQMEPWLDVFARRFRPKIGERKAVVPQAHDAHTVSSFENNRCARAFFFFFFFGYDGCVKHRVVSPVALDCRCCCSVNLDGISPWHRNGKTTIGWVSWFLDFNVPSTSRAR